VIGGSIIIWNTILIPVDLLNTSTSLVSRRWLLLLSAAAFIWGTVVGLTGGGEIEVAGMRLSSTQSGRAFAIAAVALVAHYLFGGLNRLRDDLASLRVQVGNASALAWLAALGAFVVGLGLGTFAAGTRGGPSSDYEPLPIIAMSPTLLDDAAEIRDYVNAFPLTSYRPYNVRGAGRFFVDNTDDVIKRIIVSGEAWEGHILKALEEHVVPGTVVIDVGAHIGTHTVPIARLVGPWGRVYAFEPQRKIFRELHHNLALNGATNAVALRYAVGSGDTRIIEMNPATPGNEGGTGVGAGGDRAELRTLDSFGFERVSLIKIDVEHFENAVIDGAIDTIRRNRPTILIEIMGGEDFELATRDVQEQIRVTLGKLEELGYTVKLLFKHDYIAVPKD
jgi:FkbM family methyltransferase